MMKSMHGRIDLLTSEQMDWCDEHCKFKWFVKDNGKVYSENGSIYFENKKTIKSFYVDFGDCVSFYCDRCNYLKILKGSPRNIKKNFSCNSCKLLRSLEGAPESVGGYFDCAYCESLVSLEGAPERVGNFFSCAYCDSLRSLKGKIKNIGTYFSCTHCGSLESLEGAPENVDGYFYCGYCKSLEFIDGLKNTKIKEKIYYDGCSKLEKYDSILGDMNVFKMWQISSCSIGDFMKEYNGYLEAKNYGI